VTWRRNDDAVSGLQEQQPVRHLRGVPSSVWYSYVDIGSHKDNLLQKGWKEDDYAGRFRAMTAGDGEFRI
jgi:hypothetical protein